MKLDTRIIEGKKPLTCFDTEEAKEFIGKECYFSCVGTDFGDLKYCAKGIMRLVAGECPFAFEDDEGNHHGCTYCLPCDWVKEKEPEPKYRPYKNYGEMFQDVSVGQIITFRDKGYTNVHYAEIIEAYENKCGDWFVVIGNGVRSFAGWFDTIEVKDDETGQWVPFGVPEK